MSGNNVTATVAGLSLVLGIAAGVLFDVGLYGTAWACGAFSLLCLLLSGPAGELFDSE